ncbi:hypothetical protein [uncultured Polaribacter sp.]|uniref:hypothetical protein n=1 Tax=uncultured Polaribacter sp. TaxID=174711 RepID=UPI00262FDC41|nr:hypothetical protein [uncultured Polaribacter sp.]
MAKKLLLLFLCCVSFISLSQERKTLLSGKLIDSLGIVKNANIINIDTNQGTFSSDEGNFRMFVSEGDSLQISSIQHITKKIIITKNILASQPLTITLKLNTYVLDEFELKKHNLTGRLGIDLKDVPNNRKDSILRDVMDFSNVNMKIVEGDDYIDKRVRPHLVNTDPNSAFVGAGTAIGMPFKYSERLWALRKKLDRKKAFPYKLFSELGEKFFFEKLKIPVENYFHFLEYCNPLGIEKLHKENNLLEIIKILQKESVTYLKIIKKE